MRRIEDTHEDEEEFDKIPGIATNDYSAFRSHLNDEIREEGLDHTVDEKEAKGLFDMMRSHYTESSSMQEGDFSERKSDEVSEDYSSRFLSHRSKDDNTDMFPLHPTTKDFPISAQFGEVMQPQLKATVPTPTGLSSHKMMYADDFLAMISNDQQVLAEKSNQPTLTAVEESALSVKATSMQVAIQNERDMTHTEAHISELQQLLPGLPISRIKKISEEFEAVLGYPSVLRLALVLRENMPDTFGPQCLTRKNLANAKHLYDEASKSGIVDIHIVNAMLQVHTNSGRIDPAIRFYETEFQKMNMVSDRGSKMLLIKLIGAPHFFHERLRQIIVTGC